MRGLDIFSGDTEGPSERWLAVMIGVVACLVVVGPGPLNPANIGWLWHPDPAMHYLGWAYYRASPFGWPIAMNPNYGMEVGGSILMSDALPLLAIPAKLIAPLFPFPFQYLGLWLLIGFVLQAWFTQRIVALFLPNALSRLAAVAIALFAPPMLGRIAMIDIFHLTLSGQWFIPAALYFYLTPERHGRIVHWTALLCVAIFAHPYLFVMTAALFAADRGRRLVARPGHWLRVSVDGIAALAVPLILARLLGLFAYVEAPLAATAAPAVDQFGDIGYGYYKFNLVSFFDPRGWSYVLPDWKLSWDGEVEGFAYLGLGLMLLMVVALARFRHWRSAAWAREHWPLGGILLALLIFAVSWRMSVGPWTLNLHWPPAIVKAAAVLRSGGRFVWPIFYCAMFATFWAIGRSGRPRFVAMILVAAALVQIADTRAGWARFASVSAEAARPWPNELDSPFWRAAARQYHEVRATRPQQRVFGYRRVAHYAVLHGLPTDVVYLARLSPAAVASAQQRVDADIAAGKLDRTALWIADDEHFAAIRARGVGPADLLATIDGLHVFAPDFCSKAGRALAPCSRAAPVL